MNEKQLSNPFSTGGGGGHFEAHVQASFVTLMLTSGYAPCLPCWPIKEIKLCMGAKGMGFLITLERSTVQSLKRYFESLYWSLQKNR